MVMQNKSCILTNWEVSIDIIFFFYFLYIPSQAPVIVATMSNAIKV